MIGNEVVFRVYKTPTQYAVKMLDGRALAEGYLTVPERRYFESEEKAEQWAENRAERIDEPTRIVSLGTRVADVERGDA